MEKQLARNLPPDILPGRSVTIFNDSGGMEAKAEILSTNPYDGRITVPTWGQIWNGTIVELELVELVPGGKNKWKDSENRHYSLQTATPW